MKVMWIRCIYILLAFEILVYTGLYIGGSRGLVHLFTLKKHRTTLQQEIKDIKLELVHMKQEIALWQSSDFFKEKFAREQLLMKKENETVYLHKGL